MSMITDHQLAVYRQTGFLNLPGLIDTATIARIADAVDALPGRHPELIYPENIRIEYAGSRVWKWDPVCDLVPEINALVRDERVLSVLRRIYDGREPVLFKDKLILKPPGTHGNGLHQDYTWWQGFPTSLLTVTIAIDSGTRENGCTEIYPGMHTQGLYHEPGYLGHLPDSVVEGREPERFESQPGDVGIFHCFTPHRAGENRSTRDRRQLFITYNDARDGDHYEAHYQHFLAYRTQSEPEAERGRYHIR